MGKIVFGGAMSHVLDPDYYQAACGDIGRQKVTASRSRCAIGSPVSGGCSPPPPWSTAGSACPTRRSTRRRRARGIAWPRAPFTKRCSKVAAWPSRCDGRFAAPVGTVSGDGSTAARSRLRRAHRRRDGVQRRWRRRRDTGGRHCQSPHGRQCADRGIKRRRILPTWLGCRRPLRGT